MLNNKCNLCPRKCNIDRKRQVGFCRVSEKVKIARAALHMWEEPCISGESGSGTVFFSGCNLQCVYCQNREIACGDVGKEITVDRLADIFFELKDKGANNINLVTPSHYTKSIILAIDKARNRGFSLPIVYNTSSYESVEALRMLDGYVDVYLPDCKYYDDKLAVKYSNAPEYNKIAMDAIREMYRQVGSCQFSDNGIIKSGVIVRHLVLPGCVDDSMKVIEGLYKEFGDDIFISIMNQYTPLPHVARYPELNRKLTEEEYNQVVDFAIMLGVENGFIQEEDVALESFIPAFDLEGVE